MSNPIQPRFYKSDAEERADFARIAGTVEYLPYAPDGHYFVRSSRDGQRYYFCNYTEKNGFRGMGSQTWSCVFDKDDTDMAKPYMGIKGLDDNQTNDDFVGTVLPEGSAVTFVPKLVADLMHDAETGEVYLHTQKNFQPCTKSDIRIPGDGVGMACDVALDASYPVPAGTRSLVPSL